MRFASTTSFGWCGTSSARPRALERLEIRSTRIPSGSRGREMYPWPRSQGAPKLRSWRGEALHECQLLAVPGRDTTSADLPRMKRRRMPQQECENDRNAGLVLDAIASDSRACAAQNSNASQGLPRRKQSPAWHPGRRGVRAECRSAGRSTSTAHSSIFTQTWIWRRAFEIRTVDTRGGQSDVPGLLHHSRKKTSV